MYEWFQFMFSWIFKLFGWIGDIVKNLGQAIITLLTPIWQFFSGILYLFYCLIQVLGLIFQLGFGLIDLLLSVIAGIFRTLYSFLVVPIVPDYPVAEGAEYTAAFFGFFNQWGFSTVPAIFLVFVWLGTGYGVIRIIKGGGSA